MFKLTTSIGKQAKFIVNNHKYITAIERHTPLAGLIKEGSD